MKYKIMLLGSFYHDASFRFRVEAYIKDLQKDFDVEIRYLSERPKIIPKFLKRFYKMLFLFSTALESRKYDIVFMHRIVSSYKNNLFFEKMLFMFNKNIIFDFDDAIYLHNNYKVSNVIALSNRVLAGNDFLKEYALRYNSDCFLLPTAIDTNKFQQKNNFNLEKITIGWTGTSSNYQFFSDNLIYQLKNILEKYENMKFLFICDKAPDNRFNFKYDFIKWNSKSEIEDLQKIDIGIMPLSDNEWTKGKCGFKLIQYGSVGIPALGSNIGVNKDIILDDETGYIILDDDWQNKLESLIEKFDLRVDMGHAGRKYINNNYSLKKNYENLKKILISSISEKNN